MQRIMVQNIEDVLQRGAVLSELESKSLNLTEQSRKYRKDAESLNATSWAVIAGQYSYISSPLILSMIDFMFCIGAGGGISLLILFLYFWVF